MIGGYEHPTVSLAKSLVNPLIIFFSLIIAVAAEHEKFSGLHLLLGIFAFLVVTQVFDGFNFFETPYPRSAGFIAHGRNLLIAWAIVLGILGAVGYFSGMIGNFNPSVLLVWSILTPISLLIGQSLVRGYLEILRNRGSIR